MKTKQSIPVGATRAASRCARTGKIGLFLTLMVFVGGDMFVKAFGGVLDEHQLVVASAPLIFLFGILAACGEIAARTLGNAANVKQ